jgi:hypothetical protein
MGETEHDSSTQVRIWNFHEVFKNYLRINGQRFLCLNSTIDKGFLFSQKAVNIWTYYALISVLF